MVDGENAIAKLQFVSNRDTLRIASLSPAVYYRQVEPNG
jgi:hypothetical protein